MANFNKIFRGTIENGELDLNNPDTFQRYLELIDSDEVEVIVREPKKQRTGPQNNYYWGVIVDRIAEETGMFPNEVHEGLKSLFLQKEIEMGDQIVTVTLSTSDLDRHEEWPKYTKRCREWANHELNMWIPKPNEVEIDDTIYAQTD